MYTASPPKRLVLTIVLLFRVSSGWVPIYPWCILSTGSTGIRGYFCWKALSTISRTSPASRLHQLPEGCPLLDPSVAGKFKILTCSSTSCSQKRASHNLDQYSTFSAFYVRVKGRAPSVRVEESPCLGSCKEAPCVGIEHDDFIGPVALTDMTESEFSVRVFHRVLLDDDVDRVWSAVEEAIQLMAAQDEA
jgi:hypothetical protein